MEILRLYINVTGSNTLSSENVTVNMVLFDGYGKGEYFNGTILSGGVDTQVYPANQPGTLSARYMLKGIDFKNNPCQLFIENNGIVGADHTSPKIYTDSKELKWLEQEELVGRLEFAADQLMIVIEKK